MKFERCPVVEHGKCESPENTVRRLERALGSVHDYRYEQDQLAEFLYWGGIFIDAIGFEGMGKGISPVLCKASALAETAERLAVRDLTRLPGYVEAHQKELDAPLALEDLLAHVSTATPEIIRRIQDAELARKWVDAQSLMSGRTLKIPIAYIHGISGTNGLAAGNRIEEAIVQGTNEVFERRTAITVLKNRLVMPTYDPETVESPVIRRQIDAIRGLGIEMFLKDFSFGGVLPCVGVYLINRNIPADLQAHHVLKVGTSFDREEAVMRALTEFSQGRRTEDKDRPMRAGCERIKCMGKSSDNFLSLFQFGYVSYDSAEFLKEGDVVPFEGGRRSADCLEDIERAKGILRLLGRDYLVADLTDPRIGFPVAQVVVPGYSDILPYHPRSSQVLFKGWRRNDIVGYYDELAE